MALNHSLVFADVYHKRFVPKPHVLKYQIYNLCVNVDDLPSLQMGILSFNRFNLMSFYEKDYAFAGQHPRAWVQAAMAQWGVQGVNGDIMLLTMPRILGFGFNPVSFWFCLNRAGGLRCVISEVNNTFGERHCYISYHEDGRDILPEDVLHAQKVFFVSPFLEVKGEYQFRFTFTPQRMEAVIHYHDERGLVLVATTQGAFTPYNTTMLLRAFLKVPLLTVKVVGMIHLHAVQLIFKGIGYLKKPKPPQAGITK